MANKHDFSADVARLLEIITHSFYSKRNIFVRELLANASDALTRYRQRIEPGVACNDLCIKVTVNHQHHCIVIEDNGIGMTQKELVQNLGTIARSGTLDNLPQDGAAELVGEFGLGFYSAFLVAARVNVLSKHADEPTPHLWSSDGVHGFAIRPTEALVGRGTHISLQLLESQWHYLDPQHLTALIHEFCEFISYPVYLRVKKAESVGTWEQVNKVKAIWRQNPTLLSVPEYREFYHGFSGDAEDPLVWRHIVHAGPPHFRALLYVPAHNQLDQLGRGKKGLSKIYKRNMLVLAEDLLPEYLQFIHVLVDCDELVLNATRELVQDGPLLLDIRQCLAVESLQMVEELATKSTTDYSYFYQQYSKNLKLGLDQDTENRDHIVNLLRFPSSTLPESPPSAWTSLEGYVSRMQKGQKDVYVICGESMSSVRRSPFLERLKQHNIEVLYLVDPVDEYFLQNISSYHGWNIACVTKSKICIAFTEADRELQKEESEAMAPVISQFKKVLGSQVEQVELTLRLVESPACITTLEGGWTANMERIARAQTMNQGLLLDFVTSKKVLELNPRHPLILDLKRRVKEGQNIDQQITRIYETALLVSGFPLPDSVSYAKWVSSLMIEKSYLSGPEGVPPPLSED